MRHPAITAAGITPVWLPGQRRQEHRHEQRGDEPQPLHREAEEKDGRDEHRDRPPGDRSDIACLAGDESVDGNENSEQDQHAAQYEREKARAHAQRATDLIGARRDGECQPEGREGPARKQILTRLVHVQESGSLTD